MMANRHRQLQPAFVCALLILATLAVYWPVRNFEFVNYDDPTYVTENQHVSSGLTWEGIGWAVGRLHGERTYWHPLTWISHMVDCQLFGLSPGGHHLMNVVFHLLNTLLVFLVFLRMTGSLWRCAVLAGFFALHPLQVDTVAWVAERKNLLSTLFGLVAIWAFAAYVGKSKVQGLDSKVLGPRSVVRGPWSVVSGFCSTLQLPSSHFYFLSLVLFAVGLMCKPVLVTLPFVLLLLDYWPLRRFSLGTLRKPPAPPLQSLPHPTTPVLRLVVEKLPFFVLSAASCAITLLAHRGLGMLEAASARPLGFRIENALVSYVRYLGNTFWPSKLAVLYPLPAAWPAWTAALSGGVLLAISALASGSARRRPYLPVGWLWFVGTLVPFIGLIQAGSQAMADRFAYLPLIGLFLGLVWTAAELSHRWPHRSVILPCAAILVLVVCATLTRRQVACWQNSIALFEHALAVTTGNYIVHLNLGDHLAKQGRFEEARPHFTAAVQLRPDVPEIHHEFGRALLKQQRTREAIAQLQEAVRLRPNWAGVLNNLAWLLATHASAEFRNGAEAVPLAERACRLTGGTNVAMLATLAAAYAEAGRFPDAVSTQQKVCELTAAQGQTGVLESFRNRLELYRSGQPYRVPAANP